MKVQKILNTIPNQFAQKPEIIEGIRNKTFSAGVSDKFKPAGVLVKEKIKNLAEKTGEIVSDVGKFVLNFMLEIGLQIVGALFFLYCAITVIPFFERLSLRYDLKEEMNKTILLDESDGGKEITKEEEVAFYDAVEFFNKEYPGFNWIFNWDSLRTCSVTKDFVFSATKPESDGGIKITDKEKQEFELLKTQKKQERAEKKALKKNRLK